MESKYNKGHYCLDSKILNHEKYNREYDKYHLFVDVAQDGFIKLSVMPSAFSLIIFTRDFIQPMLI